MKYTSKIDICKEFNIDPELETEDIIKELTKIQATIHPDVNPNFTQEDKEKFTSIEEAKGFLRNYKSDSQIVIADLLKAIEILDEQNKLGNSNNKSLQNEVKQSADNIVKTFKRQYLARKISSAVVWAFISLIWVFPNVILEHPILGQVLDIEFLYTFLSVIWLLSFLTACIMFLFAYGIESKVERIMLEVQKIEYQYEVFNCFVASLRYKAPNANEFSYRQLKEYLDYALLTNTNYMIRNKRIFKQLNAHIREVTPQITNMIINYALKKGIITKKNEIGWYDTYLINI